MHRTSYFNSKKLFHHKNKSCDTFSLFLMEISQAIYWYRKYIKINASLYQSNWINVYTIITQCMKCHLKQKYEIQLSSNFEFISNKSNVIIKNILTLVVKMCSIFYINVISSSSRYNKIMFLHMCLYVYKTHFLPLQVLVLHTKKIK